MTIKYKIRDFKQISIFKEYLPDGKSIYILCENLDNGKYEEILKGNTCKEFSDVLSFYEKGEINE